LSPSALKWESSCDKSDNMSIYDVPLGVNKPEWVHDKRVNYSHRANLLRKDFEHYSAYGWHHNVDPYKGYYWPVEPRTERSREVNEYWSAHPICCI